MLPAPVDPADYPPRFRRFSGWVLHTGVIRVTLLFAALSSLGSLALTWLILRILLNYAEMGSAFWISLLVPLPFALVFGGTCFYLVASLEQAWRTVNELAMCDALTGLSNRRRFIPAARRELDLAQRHRQALAVVLLDVDHFKAINDTFGHLHGDTVLAEVARRCERALRATDLLARWGGEEFIMLLPNTPLPQARQLAERVREAIVCEPRIRIDTREVDVTASLGAAGIMPGQEALSLDELIRRADLALYQAKAAGRDRVAISEPGPPSPVDSVLPTA